MHLKVEHLVKAIEKAKTLKMSHTNSSVEITLEFGENQLAFVETDAVTADGEDYYKYFVELNHYDLCPRIGPNDAKMLYAMAQDKYRDLMDKEGAAELALATRDLLKFIQD